MCLASDAGSLDKPEPSTQNRNTAKLKAAILCRCYRKVELRYTSVARWASLFFLHAWAAACPERQQDWVAGTQRQINTTAMDPRRIETGREALLPGTRKKQECCSRGQAFGAWDTQISSNNIFSKASILRAPTYGLFSASLPEAGKQHFSISINVPAFLGAGTVTHLLHTGNCV